LDISLLYKQEFAFETSVSSVLCSTDRPDVAG